MQQGSCLFGGNEAERYRCWQSRVAIDINSGLGTRWTAEFSTISINTRNALTLKTFKATTSTTTKHLEPSYKRLSYQLCHQP